ncbi:hypothetical protein MTO96_005327 [Rhipicephalus appendiculatus]
MRPRMTTSCDSVRGDLARSLRGKSTGGSCKRAVWPKGHAAVLHRLARPGTAVASCSCWTLRLNASISASDAACGIRTRFALADSAALPHALHAPTGYAQLQQRALHGEPPTVAAF